MFSDTLGWRWAFGFMTLLFGVVMVAGIAFGVLYAVAFVPETDELAPIDAVFLEILKAIAFMGVGTMGGISGRKATSAIARAIVGEENNGQAT